MKNRGVFSEKVLHRFFFKLRQVSRDTFILSSHSCLTYLPPQINHSFHQEFEGNLVSFFGVETMWPIKLFRVESDFVLFM